MTMIRVNNGHELATLLPSAVTSSLLCGSYAKFTPWLLRGRCFLKNHLNYRTNT